MRPLLWLALAATLPSSAASARPAAPDLSGTWARVEVTTALSEVPVLGDLTSRTRALSLLTFTEEGGGLWVQTQVCALENETLGGAVQATFPKAFLRAVSGGRYPARLETTADGLRYVEERPTRVSGATLRNIAQDDLPKRSDDPRLEDSDRDGHPGLTVHVGGFVEGEIYVVQRDASHLEGEVSPNRRQIQGRVTWTAEQSVVGASRSMLASTPDNRPHPDPEESFFRMRRVPEGARCADIVRRSRQLFGI